MPSSAAASTLRHIGREAFTDCSALTELTLPSGLASIGDQAFKRIGGVVYLNCNLPDTDNGIFRESSITKLVIAEGVTTLGKRSFSNSSQLSSISFPSTLTTHRY